MSKLDCTWKGDANDKGEPTIKNMRLLARYKRLLFNAQKNGGNVTFWIIRIENLKDRIAKNP